MLSENHRFANSGLRAVPCFRISTFSPTLEILDATEPFEKKGQYGMRRPSIRNPLFRHRRFAGEVIVLCVRWYLRFKLSYREMAEIAKELGVLVAPSTILRWVVRYAEDFSRLWRPFERPLGRSWRCDETYSALSSARFRRVQVPPVLE
jgi:hypothetical protein